LWAVAVSVRRRTYGPRRCATAPRARPAAPGPSPRRSDTGKIGILELAHVPGRLVVDGVVVTHKQLTVVRLYGCHIVGSVPVARARRSMS
jgi:hypothetical protein